MRNVALCVGALFLACCSSVPTMQPYHVEMNDKVAYKADEDACRAYALGYKRGLSASNIGTQTARGAAQNLAGAAVQPYVPLLGAAGQGGAEALEELGLTDIAQQRVFIRCLYVKTEHDRSALVLEPLP